MKQSAQPLMRTSVKTPTRLTTRTSAPQLMNRNAPPHTKQAMNDIAPQNLLNNVFNRRTTMEAMGPLNVSKCLNTAAQKHQCRSPSKVASKFQSRSASKLQCKCQTRSVHKCQGRTAPKFPRRRQSRFPSNTARRCQRSTARMFLFRKQSS